MISWWWIVVAVFVVYAIATVQKEWERKETLRSVQGRFYVDEESLGSMIGNWWRERNKNSCKDNGNC